MKAADYAKKSEIIQQFENVCKNLFDACLEIHTNTIFIPGNHDPESMLKGGNLDMKNVTNAHKNMIAIDENLYLLGFGGSGPAFQDNTLIWEGYPYQTEQELNKDFEIVITKHLSTLNDKKSKDFIILFTHNGPSQSSTSVDWRNSDESPIYAGSDSIRDVLLNPKYRENIVVNIHGHIHLGFGMSHIGNIPVINPGSLRGKTSEENRFVILTMVQSKKTRVWGVQNVEHISLQSS